MTGSVDRAQYCNAVGWGRRFLVGGGVSDRGLARRYTAMAFGFSAFMSRFNPARNSHDLIVVIPRRVIIIPEFEDVLWNGFC